MLYNLSIEQLIFFFCCLRYIRQNPVFYFKIITHVASEKQPLPPFLKHQLAELKRRFEAVSWQTGEHMCFYLPVRILAERTSLSVFLRRLPCSQMYAERLVELFGQEI